MLVNIDSIKVKKRVRKDLGDLENLKDSLRRYGLLNPITLNEKRELIAGERRLEAAKAIGWASIDAVILDGVDPVSELEIEIEENNQRKEFSNAELLAGYKRLEKLRNPGFFKRIWNFIISVITWIINGIKRVFPKSIK
ncbi:ParB N-terminal domain-containing protein [Treponema parvum]|uniref:ParB N-terminal domain-containing protein n=1 Tax=Treponema parvum TaxID=138851 RepID=A0A975EZG3_9SPIR|nr:ParB N-terminal domain-containing protein [Treponema parvum]QTQ11572.1 ParB N-terminal domain-containing protein [Treponema parvum]QTQ16479.1 ParB N-terminal domain-containing protein [Treponema parvum]